MAWNSYSHRKASDIWGEYALLSYHIGKELLTRLEEGFRLSLWIVGLLGRNAAV